MIDRMTGRVVSRDQDGLVLDVRGIGFRLSCSSQTLTSAPMVDEDVTLVVLPLFRQDGVALIGFANVLERSLFQLLTGVSGVGPRTALVLLSHLGTQRVVHALATGDTGSLQSASGVGKRLAQRLCVELKDRVGALSLEARPPQHDQPLPDPAMIREAVELLERLGFARSEAQHAVDSASPDSARTELAELVRTALRTLGTRK